MHVNLSLAHASHIQVTRYSVCVCRLIPFRGFYFSSNSIINIFLLHLIYLVFEVTCKPFFLFKFFIYSQVRKLWVFLVLDPLNVRHFSGDSLKIVNTTFAYYILSEFFCEYLSFRYSNLYFIWYRFSYAFVIYTHSIYILTCYSCNS